MGQRGRDALQGRRAGSPGLTAEARATPIAPEAGGRPWSRRDTVDPGLERGGVRAPPLHLLQYRDEGASFLPGGRTLAVVVVFAVACVKAVLVAANFMHLRFEPALIYALVLIPLLFLVVLAAALLPDFVWHSLAR